MHDEQWLAMTSQFSSALSEAAVHLDGASRNECCQIGAKTA